MKVLSHKIKIDLSVNKLRHMHNFLQVRSGVRMKLLQVIENRFLGELRVPTTVYFNTKNNAYTGMMQFLTTRRI